MLLEGTASKAKARPLHGHLDFGIMSRALSVMHVKSFSLLALLLSGTRGQMDPAQMQCQIQREMGGGGGEAGGCVERPSRLGQLASMAVSSTTMLAATVQNHPKTTATTAAALATAIYIGKEAHGSGLVLRRSPRLSVFRPSDACLSKLLQVAEDASVASPSKGVILDAFDEACVSREQSQLKGHGDYRTVNRVTVGAAGHSDPAQRFKDKMYQEEGKGGCRKTPQQMSDVLNKAESAGRKGTYEESATHGPRGKIRSVCRGLYVGSGIGLYHKFAQGLRNLDVFDGRKDCELIASESSTEGPNSTLGLLSKSSMGGWYFSPLRVVLLEETEAPADRSVPPWDEHARRRRSRHHSHRRGNSARKGRKGSKRQSKAADAEESNVDGGGKGKVFKSVRKKKRLHVVSKRDGPEEAVEGTRRDGQAEDCLHRQFTLGLSAVEGAGWAGTWMFCVTYNANTDEVWFQTSLAQKRNVLGTTFGGDQAARVKRVNEDMLARGVKHAAVLKARAEQYARLSSLAHKRTKHAKELERDRILHPEKHKRVHRYLPDDSYGAGLSGNSRPARWGEERRRNDIRLR